MYLAQLGSRDEPEMAIEPPPAAEDEEEEEEPPVVVVVVVVVDDEDEDEEDDPELDDAPPALGLMMQAGPLRMNPGIQAMHCPVSKL